MKTLVLACTYTPGECTSVGWRIEWHAGRLMAERHCRWQGSRDGIRVLIGRMDLPAARRWVANTMPAVLYDTMGDLHNVYTVTHSGFVVR